MQRLILVTLMLAGLGLAGCMQMSAPSDMSQTQDDRSASDAGGGGGGGGNY